LGVFHQDRLDAGKDLGVDTIRFRYAGVDFR
jgi:hypothetical protein